MDSALIEESKQVVVARGAFPKAAAAASPVSASACVSSSASWANAPIGVHPLGASGAAVALPSSSSPSHGPGAVASVATVPVPAATLADTQIHGLRYRLCATIR